MKLRNTIILLALAAGLFGYLKFVDSTLPTTDDERRNKGRLFTKGEVDRKTAKAVTIRNAEGVIELAGNDHAWEITAPVKDRADTLAMSAVFTGLEGLTGREVTGVKDVKEKQKELGLTKGEAMVKITGEKTVEIYFGKDHASEGECYARIEGSEKIYVVPKGLREQLAKGLKEYRNRTLSTVAVAEVSKFTLKAAGGEFEAEKRQFNWSFTKPFKARCDNQKISDLLATTLTARIEDFITDSKDLGAYGLNEPRATLTMTVEGSKEPLVLLVGAQKLAKKDDKTDDKNDDTVPPPPATHCYVKLSTRDSVVSVPVSIETLVTSKPNDLRDTNLLRVQADGVDRITIEPHGREKIVLGRSGEDWVRKIAGKNDEPVNGGAATKLLNELCTVKTVRFVKDLADNPADYGLDKPLAVTLSSYSTEGTPEESAGDKPIAKLLLGTFIGDAGFAKLDDEPFIVAVPSTLHELVWADPIQWQDLSVLALEKTGVTALEITRAGQLPSAFTFERDKGWKLAKGDGDVNQTIAQSLINTLSELRAVRWLGPTDAAKHGMEKPALVIQFTLANKATGKLTIGSAGPDDMLHATITGKPGTFLMPKPDFEALNASLIEPPKNGSPLPPAPPGTPPAPAAPPAGNPANTPPVPPPAVPPPPAPEPAKPEQPKPTEAPSTPPPPAPKAD